MRAILVISFILFFASVCAQANDPALVEELILKEKLSSLKKLETVLQTARESGDLYREMKVLADIISYKSIEFGDITSSYADALYLEKLVNENPDFKGSKEVSPYLFSQIGWFIQDQHDYEASIPYFEKAVAVSRLDTAPDANNTNYFITKIRLAEMNFRIGNKQKSLALYHDIESEILEHNDSVLLSFLYESLSFAYKDDGDLNEALYYAKKFIYDKNPKQKLSFSYSHAADYFLELNQPDSAVIYAQTGLKIAQENQLAREEKVAHDILRQVYDSLKNDEKELYHFKKFYELEQEIRSFDNAIKIGNLNTTRAVNKATLQQAFSVQQLSSQRLIILIVSVSLLILIAGLFYVLNRLKFIRKQNKIIVQEKLKAERSERYKEQFLANMSHEIRTPMHAISGMINALKRRKHDLAQAAYLDVMKINTDNLLVILNDVLDMSKIEYGNLEIEQVNMNAIEIVQQVVNMYQNKSEEKGLLLKMDIANDFPKTLVGDPGRLNQILMNLVSNAIKFTEHGFVEINLSHGDGKFLLAVKDTGIGISGDYRSTIFESFKQGNNLSKGYYGGTGLGLAITKQLIDLQKGRIWVESEEDKGSIFYVELPLLINEEPEKTQTLVDESQLMAMGKQLKGLRVLIAEDNEFNVMVAKDDLNWYIPEIEITFAENGKLAVALYQEKAFDVILMDVQMPEMDGYEATEVIRGIEAKNNINPPIPILAMTASLLKDQIDKCYGFGMNGYIPKPYKPEDLINALHKACKRRVV